MNVISEVILAKVEKQVTEKKAVIQHLEVIRIYKDAFNDDKEEILFLKSFDKETNFETLRGSKLKVKIQIQCRLYDYTDSNKKSQIGKSTDLILSHYQTVIEK